MFKQPSPLEAPPGATLLPSVGQVQGAQFLPAKTPKESWVIAQYTDHKGKWNQLNLPFLDAMYLLNLLKAVQLQSGFKMPDDPFANPSKK